MTSRGPKPNFCRDKRKNTIILRLCELIAELAADHDDEILVNMLDKIKEFDPQFNINGEQTGIDSVKYENYLKRKKLGIKIDYTPTLERKHAEAFLRLLIMCNGSVNYLSKNSGVSNHYINNVCNGQNSNIKDNYAYRLCKAVNFKIKPEEICSDYQKNVQLHDISAKLIDNFEP